MSPQLPLNWPTPAHARFEEFDSEGNESVVAALQSLLDSLALQAFDGAPLLVVGPEGAGKTHLAIATASAARAAGVGTAYLALSRWSDFDVDALVALSSQDLVVIDEIEHCAGRREAEVAVFDLFNRCRDEGRALLLLSRQPPAQLPLQLPDLRSRLNAATLHALNPLPEDARRRLVQRRARARGFDLDDTVLDFLFRRHRRDLPALLDLVDRIDRESLARQRRVTVPLVRAVLEEGSGLKEGQGLGTSHS